jgi:PAS domain S-box-containing protein
MTDRNPQEPELSILSLEDSARDFEIIHEYLANAGFKMKMSRVYKENQFISSLRNNRYDIILADFKLPGFNAFNALKWAREICPDVPFICISGSIGEETAIELIKQGAVDYIIKDRLGRLPLAIRRALDEGKILESKRVAREMLTASETLLSGLFNNMPSGAAIYEVINQGEKGTDYIIKNFNQTSLAAEKKPIGEVIGKSLYDIRPAIDNYGLIPVFKRVWETGKPEFFPSKAYVDENFNNYYENYIFKIPTGEIVAIYNDVTIQRRTEEALVESEERYRMAMQVSRDGLFDWNLITNGIYYSPGWKKILGYEEDELANEFSVWEQLTEPADAKKSWEMLKDVIERKRERFELVFRMKHKKGHWVDVLSRANALFNDNGRAIRVVGTHVDVSDRIRTEKILHIQYNIAREVVLAKNMEQLVETVQNELSSLLDTRNFFLALYDPEKDTLKQVIYKDENDAFGEWKTENSLSGIVVKQAKTMLLKRSEIEQIAKEFNLVLLGTQAECWLGVPLSTGDTVIGAMVVQSYSDPDAYDLTSAALMEIIANELSTFIVRKSAEEKILLMNEELESRVAERTVQLQASYDEMEAFSYTVSHDLRAPVRGIHGFTQILMEDYAGKLDDEGKRVCAVIQENALRMGQLIDDLLAFSRLQRAPMVKSVIDMKALVTSVYHEMTDDETRLRINMTIGDVCNALADPNLIRQVWTNLISNAIKYTSKRKNPAISVTCKATGGICVYCITDNGSGFEMKYKDKLFNVFQRLHNVKDYEGNGVGLASVKRIIERHGGEVWAEGAVDKGAAFSFSLAAIGH